MSGQANKWAVSVVLLATICVAACAADKDEKKSKDKKKDKDTKPTPAELFTPSKEFEAKEARNRNIAQEIEEQVAARAVPVPAEMQLDVDWYSPHINLQRDGKVTKGWVIDDVILLETDKKNLICVRRNDGVERWRCELTDAIRYTPSVSRNNVVVNVNNHLVSISKDNGYIRWKLLPNFVMSCSPLVIDPPAYPKDYTRDWKNLETIYVGSWDGRFHAMYVRGRLSYYMRNITKSDEFSAPEFDLFYSWHKTHKDRGVITSNIVLKDNILTYSADDQKVYAVTREGAEREPYFMLGQPVTGTTVKASLVANVTNSFLNSIYVGARDNYVYCLDRLTLKKKWAWAAGYPAVGNILSDEAATPMVYVATSNGMLNALQVQSSRTSKGQPETPETFSQAWQVPGEGAIEVSPDTVYVGTGRNASAGSFGGITAVDKTSGKVRWKVDGGFFTQYLESHTGWGAANSETRIYTITADNRLIALKEKIRDTGVRVANIPQPEEQPKMPTKKQPKADGAEGAAAPAAEEKK